MEKYGDIIKRIDEIIYLSNIRKSELTDEELNNYNDYFVKKLGKDIALEYADEMQSLLDLERTFYLVENTENILLYNDELKKLCQNHIESSKENENEYIRLLEILNNCSGKSITEIIEFNSYYVLKNDLVEFIDLCRKLTVGPYKLLKDMEPAEAKKIINNQLKNFHDQSARINTSVNKLSDKKQLVLQSNALQVEENLSVTDTPKILNGKYKECVYLGLIGQLKVETIISLKEILTNEEFEELIAELNRWQVLTEEDLVKIHNSVQSNIKVVNNIDDLIGYFALRENINIEGLKLLIPTIGVHNFNYMINRLYELGAININDYLSYLEFKNSIKKKA